ncbi:hypothetical protein K7X08_016613 [Anisodus acutangulus]|uniref:OPA3-like protein n=1 Tax=Anisodus acutangulus TaxID=402998 RepID=A0A9Q1LE30_9SOLA|nr:hypothetical protein K7X08_016613 [Anisodus acutangulus]
MYTKSPDQPISSVKYTKPKAQKEAGLHPKFRNFIISIAQVIHRLTTTMQRRIYDHATDVGIRPLNEEKAVQAAVNLLGEFFVFSVAVAALVFEVQRSSRSEAKKEELRRQEMEKLRQRDEALEKEMEGLKRKIQELEQLARGKGLAGGPTTLTIFTYISFGSSLHRRTAYW